MELSAASPAAAAAVDLVELAHALIATFAKQCTLFGSRVLLTEVLKGRRDMKVYQHAAAFTVFVYISRLVHIG